MKESEIKEFFDKIAGSPEKNFNELIDKSLGFFQEVVEDFKEASPEKREEMTDMFKQIEEDVNKKFDTLCETVGISRDDLQKMIADPKSFDPQEWSLLQDFQHKLEESLGNPKTEKKSSNKKTHKQKNKKAWLSA